MSNKTALSVPARSSTARGKAQTRQLRAQQSRAAAISATGAMAYAPGGGRRGGASRCGSAGADIAARGGAAALRRLIARSGARKTAQRLLLMTRLIHDVSKQRERALLALDTPSLQEKQGVRPLATAPTPKPRAPEPVARLRCSTAAFTPRTPRSGASACRIGVRCWWAAVAARVWRHVVHAAWPCAAVPASAARSRREPACRHAAGCAGRQGECLRCAAQQLQRCRCAHRSRSCSRSRRARSSAGGRRVARSCARGVARGGC